jgi:hypothetical protein
VEDPKIIKYKTPAGKAGYRIRWDHGSKSFSDPKRETVASFKVLLMAHGMRHPGELGLWPPRPGVTARSGRTFDDVATLYFAVLRRTGRQEQTVRQYERHTEM